MSKHARETSKSLPVVSKILLSALEPEKSATNNAREFSDEEITDEQIDKTIDQEIYEDDDEEMAETEYDPEEPAGMLKGLQDVDAAVDERMERSTLRLFKGSKAVEGGSDDDSDSDDDIPAISTDSMVPYRSRGGKMSDENQADDTAERSSWFF